MKPTIRRASIVLGAGATAAGLLGLGYVGLNWVRYGRANSNARSDPLLDRFMPVYEVREYHQTEVPAPAELAFAVARELDLQESGLVRTIFKGRELLMGADSARREAQPFLSEVIGLGWRVLHEESGRKLVMGAVTRAWQANVRFRGLDPEQFASFQEPGYAKIIWTLEAEPTGAESSVFRTETRVTTTDAESRRRFRHYWSMVSPGVVLIRHEMLRLVRREAARRFRSAPSPV
ncbi:MAG TPA: hypothetical protein VFH24_04045 [Gemmatimonadales bacterium]|nr:hypothetical protein [Gemmatimonadales bacterium]